jgi:glucose/mannose-6-phosphate isomerase
MDLDDLARFRELDPQGMQSHIDRLPDQLEAAWALGRTLPLPGSFKRIERIVIAAMGSSALAGEMLAALVADNCNIPILVNRGYGLPAYVDGQRTLVVGVTYSGDDEETLCALELAETRSTQMMLITGCEALAQHAEKSGLATWAYRYDGPARTALGWNVGLLLALVCRLGLVRDLSADVAEAVAIMREGVTVWGVESPVVKNPAKRLAGQLIGRVPVVHGAGILVPVARRWKAQLNENAKSVAQWEEMPELNHNTVEGLEFPPPLMARIAVVFLQSPRFDPPRVALRFDLTQTLYLQQGLVPDTVRARGNSPLAQVMSTVQFGDYVSFYVAMACGVNPTPVPSITQLKEKLAAAPPIGQ